MVTDSQRKVIRQSFGLSAGSIGAFVFTFLQGLITPRVLGVEGYGTLAVLSLILSYVSYIQSGIKSAQTLLVPASLGRGDKREAQRIGEVVFTVEIFLIVIILFSLGGAYIQGVTFGGIVTPFLLEILLAAIFLARFNEFLDSYLLGYGEFGLLARLQFFTALLNFLFGVPLLIFYGIEGLLCATVLTYLLMDSYILWSHQIRFRFRWEWKDAARYIRIGFPIYINNWIGSYLFTLEKTLIVLMLDKVALGLYSFGLLVFNPVNLIPGALSKIVKWRMTERRGQFGLDDVRYMQHFFGFPLACYLFLCVILVGTAFSLYQVLVINFYSQYLESVNVFLILIFGYPFFQLRAFSGTLLTILNRSWRFFACQVIILGVNIITDVALMRAGYGIYGAATGSSISYFILGFLLLYQAYQRVVPHSPLRSALILYGRISAAWILCYALLCFLGSAEWWQMPEVRSTAHVVTSVSLGLIKTLIFTLGVLGVFSFTFQQDGFLGRVKTLARECGVTVRQRVALRPV